MTTVLNCPFCGKTPSKHPRYCMGFMGFGIKCNCGCETPNHLVDEDAVKWWNKRTPLPLEGSKLKTGDAWATSAETINKFNAELNKLKEILPEAD